MGRSSKAIRGTATLRSKLPKKNRIKGGEESTSIWFKLFIIFIIIIMVSVTFFVIYYSDSGNKNSNTSGNNSSGGSRGSRGSGESRMWDCTMQRDHRECQPGGGLPHRYVR